MLRINNEYLDKNTGKKISNVRAEINGSDLIQEYCKTNNLQRHKYAINCIWRDKIYSESTSNYV